jgi:UDP-N-acetylmuramoyl-L-alanyl-D-glutamate--2,6-diaminopimelate ligase
MVLNEILHGIDIIKVEGDPSSDIQQIAYDSRKVRDNCLFCCVKGFKSNGHHYAKQAVEKGACALLIEDDVDVPSNITKIYVSNARRSMGLVASNFYGRPTDKLTVLGVTGTNGKTTVCYLIKCILEAAGKKVGLIGTIQNMIGNEIIETERTTPEAIDLQALFADMVGKNVEIVVMEVASHALALDRVAGCQFNVSGFTNLTQDHLDFHGTMQEYKKAKAKLFEISDVGVINIDDSAGKEIVQQQMRKILTCGVNEVADIYATDIELKDDGAQFVLNGCGKEQCVKLKTSGLFSVYNALIAAGMCRALNTDVEYIKTGLETATVHGRFERIGNSADFSVILDYAHTPDGLENVLKTAQAYAKGRVVCLFGCGGNRDATKRPIMGRIAGELADYCIVTSDNPRNEDPFKIIDDVLVGVKQTKCDYSVIENRREAIEVALNMARRDDIIILAGKGHETYQEINGQKNHFNEKEIVEALMKVKEKA